MVVFSKHFLAKASREKEKNRKVEKKSKQRLTVVFFISADGGKVCKPIVIWKSKKSRCFKRANTISKLG